MRAAASLLAALSVLPTAGALWLGWQTLAGAGDAAEADEHGWPRSVDALPAGDPEAGRRVFVGRGACYACHGDPARGRSPIIGPSLAGVSRTAAARTPGAGARQYLFESVLEPNAYIAPTCPTGVCSRPSNMPGYRDKLSRKELADLLAYLATL